MILTFTVLAIGNGAMMVRVFPYGAVQFLTYEKCNQILNSLCDNSPLNKLIAGSFAGRDLSFLQKWSL